jgi:exosortase
MKLSAIITDPTERKPEVVLTLAGLACLLSAGLWAYWPTLAAMASIWVRDPQYSHGWLVPAFAAALLWQRRAMLAVVDCRPHAWGLPLLLGAALLRAAGAYWYYPWLDMASLLPFLAGVVVLAGGWSGLRWAWPGLAFLLFMLPLPYRLGMLMAPALQRVATIASTYSLQTLGFPAISEGNIIILHDSRIGVVEACGGLSMLIVFFALSTAVAAMVRRPLLDRLLLVASAIPIAVIANVARITVTALVHDGIGPHAGELCHDLAGWLMMTVALGLLALELQLLARLLLAPRAA